MQQQPTRRSTLCSWWKSLVVLGWGSSTWPRTICHLGVWVEWEKDCPWGHHSSFCCLSRWTRYCTHFNLTRQGGRTQWTKRVCSILEHYLLKSWLKNRFERVKKIHLSLEPFNVDDNTLTPTLKVRRKECTKSTRRQLMGCMPVDCPNCKWT